MLGAVRRDAERARMTVRQYFGNKILVQREVREGHAVMAFGHNRVLWKLSSCAPLAPIGRCRQVW